MTDYVSILTRAIADKSSYEERRGVYERARQALVSQLRSIDPPLSEGDITKQRLALEAGIRTVEASAGTAKAEAQPSIQPQTSEPPPPAAMPPAPQEARAVPEASAALNQPTSRLVIPPPMAENPKLEATLQRVPSYVPEPLPKDAPSSDPAMERVSTYTAARQALAEKRPSNLIIGLMLVALVAIGGVVAAWLMVRGSMPASQQQAATNSQGGKIADRVAQDPSLQGENAAVSQAAYLTEENIEAPKGSENFRGKVSWRVDTEANPQGQGPERIIRGLVEIPDRNLRLLMNIRRNTDAALPASHTIELIFDVPSDFIHGAIESVAGMRMKPSEQANGLPLASASARITTGYFLLGLSSLPTEKERNTVLLRDRPWMDLLVLYRNGRRAVLTIEKGVPGEKVFTDTFKNWGN